MQTKIYQKRIQQARKILVREKLDIILVYSSIHEYRYGLYFTGVRPKLFHYFFINSKNCGFLELPFLINDLKKYTNFQVTSISQEGNPLGGFLNKYRKIGILGEAPLNHFQSKNMQMHNLVDLKDKFELFLFGKSREELKNIRKAAKVLKKIFTNLTDIIQPGITQIELAKKIKLEIIKYSDDLSFPITITAGNNLAKTTVDFPKEQPIMRTDVLCVDLGAIINGFSADCTRMYFIGKHPAEKKYLKLLEIHNHILGSIKVGMSFADIYQLYRQEISKVFSDEKYKYDNFLGHNIGFGLHEQPYLVVGGKFMDMKISEGSVFTLEPEVRFADIRIRVEDMVAVIKGKVTILTK